MNLEELKNLGDIVTPAEVKQKTGLGRTVLDKLNAEGILNKIYLSERSYVYKRHEINQWLTNCFENPEAFKGSTTADKARVALEKKRTSKRGKHA